MENSRFMGTRHSLVRALVHSARCVLDPRGWNDFMGALQGNMNKEHVPAANRKEIDRYLLDLSPEKAPTEDPKSGSDDDDLQRVLQLDTGTQIVEKPPVLSDVEIDALVEGSKEMPPSPPSEDIEVETIPVSEASLKLEFISNTILHPFSIAAPLDHLLFQVLLGHDWPGAFKVNGFPVAAIMTSQFTRVKKDGTRVTENINGKVEQTIIRNCGPDVLVHEDDAPLEFRRTFRVNPTDEDSDSVEGRAWFYLVYLKEGLKLTLWHNQGSAGRDIKRKSFTFKGGKVTVRNLT